MKQTKVIFYWLVVAGIIIAIGSPVVSADMKKININTATVKELTKLKKIGEKTAQKIVEYREKNGPYKEAKDITNVKGVGSKIWEMNKDLITVGDI